MALFLVLLILYVFPISLGIIIVYILVKNYFTLRLAKIIRKILFICLSILFIAVNIYSWWSRQYSLEFKLTKNCLVNIDAEVIESFLDSPTNFEIEFKNIKTGKIIHKKFNTSEGFGLEFLVSEQNENLIQIKGGPGNNINPKYINISDKKPSSKDFHFSIKKELISRCKLK
jgi:hypothetical protein